MAKTPIDVRKFRERLGLTQEEFAKRIGTSTRTLHRWENQVSHPQVRFRNKMDALEEEKFAGTAPERPATKAPYRRRGPRLPQPSEGTGETEHIGIAPSSY